MEEVLMEATGVDGKVLLFKDIVRIKRIGVASFFSGASKLEKDILISQIASIQFKRAGLFTNGYMEFILMHNHQRRNRDSEDEIWNAVVSFRPDQQGAFEAFRKALEERIGSHRPRSSVAGTDLDELEKLASLRDRGIITEDEFNRKKKQILGL